MRNRIILLLIGFMCYAGMGNAQEDKTEKAVPAIVSDSVEVAAPDSTVQAVLMAALFALVPGLGQIYNRKYWKLPIVYGGLMGCMYAVTWNNKNYKDYSTAYKDIMYDAAKNLENPDAWSKSWQDLTSMAPEDAINNSNFKDQLKRQKDYFRRYRDLSIIITVGVYALSIVDAYVDAQLFDFDISPDLSLHLEPVVSPKTSVTPRTYGLNCSLKF